MLSSIKKHLFPHHKKTDKKWLFLSAFDTKSILLWSHGVIHTDKTLENLANTIYTGLMAKYEKDIKLIALDVVTDYQQETDMQKIIATSPRDFWIFVATIDNTISGLVLPNTQWVADMQQALYILKQKHPQLTWNINVFLFKTQRILCPKE